MTQTRPITIPKVTIDLVFTINFCFTRDFIPLIFSLHVILFKRITQIMFETKLCCHMFWHQNLSFWFKWVLLACFEPKMNFLLTWFLPLIFHSIPEVIVDLFFTINLLNELFFLSKKSIRYYLKKKKSFSHVLTWKSLILVQMITLRLFWTQNEILVWIWKMTLSSHFRKPKAPIFVPKSYTQFILAQTRLYRFHFN